MSQIRAGSAVSMAPSSKLFSSRRSNSSYTRPIAARCRSGVSECQITPCSITIVYQCACYSALHRFDERYHFACRQHLVQTQRASKTCKLRLFYGRRIPPGFTQEWRRCRQLGASAAARSAAPEDYTRKSGTLIHNSSENVHELNLHKRPITLVKI